MPCGKTLVPEPALNLTNIDHFPQAMKPFSADSCIIAINTDMSGPFCGPDDAKRHLSPCSK